MENYLVNDLFWYLSKEINPVNYDIKKVYYRIFKLFDNNHLETILKQSYVDYLENNDAQYWFSNFHKNFRQSDAFENFLELIMVKKFIWTLN